MKLAAIVLAAGSASRFGADKLSASFRDEPLLHHAVRAARSAPVERVIVICRPGLETGDWAGEPPVERVELESDALSSSLKAGVAAASDMDGAFIFLGDMPLVPPDTASRLNQLVEGHYAAVPLHEGKPGHPVLLSSRAFPAIENLTGDEGAWKILRNRKDVVFDDHADLRNRTDVDRPDDLARLEGLERN